MPNWCGGLKSLRPDFAKVPETELAKARKRLNRMDTQERRFSMDARKLDARRKIQLGGLIVKACLAEEPAAVLLGLLLEAAGTFPAPVPGLPSAAGAKRAKPRFIPRSKNVRTFQPSPGLDSLKFE